VVVDCVEADEDEDEEEDEDEDEEDMGDFGADTSEHM